MLDCCLQYQCCLHPLFDNKEIQKTKASISHDGSCQGYHIRKYAISTHHFVSCIEWYRYGDLVCILLYLLEYNPVYPILNSSSYFPNSYTHIRNSSMAVDSWHSVISFGLPN